MLVPTLMAAPGDGEDLAFRHDAGVDDYDHYVGTSAQFVSVDPGKAADAFTALIENPDLRRKMGEAGRQRAETTFDWKVIVGQYQELWAELKGRRTKARVTAPRGETSQANPSRGDPFALFEHYPTRIIDKDVVFEDGPVSLHDAMRLGYMGRLNGSLNAPEVDIHAVLDHLAENGATTTGALLDLVPADRRPGLRRTLVWLAKLGVIVPHW
jgi:alpha-maltose-1-phosphate synthase